MLVDKEISMKKIQGERIAGSGLLSHEDMDMIHSQALRLLAEKGVEIDHLEGLEILQGAGAEVDFDTRMAAFPESLIMKGLEDNPKKIVLGARDPEKDCVLEPGGKLYSRNTGGMAHIRDMGAETVRDVNLEDVAEFTRLIDGLDYIDFVAPIYAEEVHPAARELHVLKAMVSNTTKHTNIRALDLRKLPYLAEAAIILSGGEEELRKRPQLSILEAPIAPLKFPDVYVDTLFLSGKYGIPVEVCSMPILGATGPITIAGNILLTIVEHLATFAVAQAAHPGTPVIWAPRYPSMDMATGFTGMTIEGALASAAAAQMITEYYNMVCDLHGPATNSIIADGKCALEEAFAGFTTAYLGGPAVLAGAGGLELGLVANFEDLVIANEIFGVIKRILKGFEVNEETLGREVIERVGVGGNYLTDTHTMQFLRSERYESDLIRPEVRAEWVNNGSVNFRENVRKKAQDILANHQPEPMDSVKLKALDDLIKNAQKEFGDD